MDSYWDMETVGCVGTYRKWSGREQVVMVGYGGMMGHGGDGGTVRNGG